MKLLLFCFRFSGGSEQHRGERQKSFVSFRSIFFTIKLSRNQKRLLWRRVGLVGTGVSTGVVFQLGGTVGSQ